MTVDTQKRPKINSRFRELLSGSYQGPSAMVRYHCPDECAEDGDDDRYEGYAEEDVHLESWDA